MGKRRAPTGVARISSYFSAKQTDNSTKPVTYKVDDVFIDQLL